MRKVEVLVVVVGVGVLVAAYISPVSVSVLRWEQDMITERLALTSQLQSLGRSGVDAVAAVARPVAVAACGLVVDLGSG